jgi:octaprenyl-diphosphate synthase
MQLPANADISVAFSLIDNELDKVRELIDKQLTDSGEFVAQLVGSLNVCGGKMIRPGLVLLAGAACGGITDRHIHVAAIVEMIHNATLLHDDVIDEGQKRRGLPTINSLWGNESAVLLGDFLLSRVFRMCADLQPQVARVITATAGRVCEGELRQVIQRQDWQLSEPEYVGIITEKSAALFSCACILGALLADAGETQVRLLDVFGLNTGIAFQITDDLLDIVGDESKAGKTLRTDINKNKLTLAVIHLLQAVDKKEKKVVINLLRGRHEEAGKVQDTGYEDTLVKMLMSYGSLEYTYRSARDFAAKAVFALESLEESDAKGALIETAKYAAGRSLWDEFA